jgi:hypothetical protein
LFLAGIAQELAWIHARITQIEVPVEGVASFIDPGGFYLGFIHPRETVYPTAFVQR